MFSEDKVKGSQIRASGLRVLEALNTIRDSATGGLEGQGPWPARSPNPTTLDFFFWGPVM